MSTAPDIAWSRRLARTTPGLAALWAFSAMLMLGAHAGAGWWLMREPPATLPEIADAPMAVMIDLAEIAMAPSADEDQVAPDDYDSVEVNAPEPVPVEDVAEPVETAETVEPVDETLPVDTALPDIVEPVEMPDEAEPVDVARAEEVEPVEASEPAVDEPAPVEPDAVEPAAAAAAPAPVEEPDRLAAVAADAVDPTIAEPAAPSEVSAAAVAEPETVTPVAEEIDPVEEMVIAALSRADIPLPQARPEPPRQPVQREQPRPQKQQATRPAPKKAAQPPRRQQAAPSQAASKAKSTAAAPSQRAAAPQNSAGKARTISPARWQSRLMSHLERRKRYPAAARRQRKQGVAQVRFSIDANGNVGSVRLTRSSGVAELDAEVVSLVRRASPVPAPPPGVGRTIVVPIQFSLR